MTNDLGRVFLNLKEGTVNTLYGSYQVKAQPTHGPDVIYGYSKWWDTNSNSHKYSISSNNISGNLIEYEDVLSTVSGNVFLAGIGAGAVLLLLSDISKVTNILAVDNNLGAIELYKRGNYPNSNKINFIHDNAYNIEGEFDYIIDDCWYGNEYYSDQTATKEQFKAKSNNNILYCDTTLSPNRAGPIGKGDQKTNFGSVQLKYDIEKITSMATRINAVNEKINA